MVQLRPQQNRNPHATCPRCKIRLVDALPHRVVTSQWWSTLGVASIAKMATRCYWLSFTWCFLSVKNNFCTASGTRQMDGRRFFCWLLFNCRKLMIINYITLIPLIKSITIVLKQNIKCSNNKCSNNFIYVLDKYYFCCMRSKINEIIYY